MKEMKEAEIKYHKNNFSVLETETSWKTFYCCHWSFFFTSHPKKKDEPKNRLEGKPSGSILILLQIYFSADTTVLHFKQSWDADLDKVRL